MKWPWLTMVRVPPVSPPPIPASFSASRERRSVCWPGLQPGAAIQLLAAIGRSLVARLRKDNQKYIDLLLSGGPTVIDSVLDFRISVPLGMRRR